MLVPHAVVAGTGSPIGVIVGDAVKARGEITGSATIGVPRSGPPRRS
jgi:hypothetical protein